MNPKNLLVLIEPEEIKKNHIRVLLTLMGTPEGEGLRTSTLEDLVAVSKRTLGRLKPVLIEIGWASVLPATGSNDEDVWSITSATRQQLTASGPLDLSALSLAASKPRKGPDPLRFGKTKYRSVLERDVAVCLACLGVRYQAEFSYRKLIGHKSAAEWDETSIPDWRCDFIVEVADNEVKGHGVIEVAGVKGNSAYRATLRAKKLALAPVGVPFLQLDGMADLVKIPGFIEGLRSRTAARASQSTTRHSSPDGSHVTTDGVYIDPRAVNKKMDPGETRRPPPSLYPTTPPEDASWRIQETPEERELRRAEEALEEQRHGALMAARMAVREEFKARWDEEDAVATAEDRVTTLAAALEWEEAQRTSRQTGSRDRDLGTGSSPDDARDREAPWEHTDLDEEDGYEADCGDISDYPASLTESSPGSAHLK